MLRKYTLYLAGMLGLILGSVGCGGTHHHHGTTEYPGYMAISWRIVDSRTGAEASCEWAGINQIQLASQDVYSNIEPYYDDFNCTEYQGVSAGFPESSYAVAVYGFAPDIYDPLTGYTFSQPFPVYQGQTTTLPIITLYYP